VKAIETPWLSRATLALAVALAGVAALPGVAAAGTVSISTTLGQLTYTGDSGPNTVTIAWDGTAYTVTDSVPIAANPASGCILVTANTASCPDVAIGSIRASVAPSASSTDVSNTITLDPSLPDDEPATVQGAAGADTFAGQAAAETFNGADGDDAASGGSGNDALYGDAGGDHLSGGDGHDNLRGNNPGNSFRTRDSADTLQGGAGDDFMTGHEGSDMIDGGTGRDTADYTEKKDFDPIGVTLDDDTTRNDGGASDGTAGNRDVVRTNVEQIIGGEGADTIRDALTASTVDHTFEGRAGSDVMNGGLGNDSLAGGDGGDTLTGGAGIDSLLGGGGDDQLFARDGISETTVDCGTGTDSAQIDGVTAADAATGCETVDAAG
jgi:Ca2+-binding RTX toxin-like protein